MIHDTPLREKHALYAASLFQDLAARAGEQRAGRDGAATGHATGEAEVLYLPYGPLTESGQPMCEMVGTYGSVELAYSVLRRGAGLMDQSTRGTLIVTGAERIDFLNRMITQELSDLSAGGVRRSFWLNRKGRIDADFLVAEFGDRIVIDVDIHQVRTAATTLESYIFTEDVAIEDATNAHHHLALHGPQTVDVLVQLDAAAEALRENDTCTTLTIDGVAVLAIRSDVIGVAGVELIVPRDDVEQVWSACLSCATDDVRVRPCGWFAYNIARIESAQPMFNIDFGPTSLPHETSLNDSRVSFTKGCYLGQEVVARMESLGQPKQKTVGVRMDEDALPVMGGQVFDPPAGDDEAQFGDVIGVVTSSTISPLLGAQPICLVTIKTAKAASGRAVVMEAEGAFVPGTLVTLEELRSAAAPPTS